MSISSVQPGVGRPAEQKPGGEERHGGAALARNRTLADEERANEEQALVDPAHGDAGRPKPSHGARVGSDRGCCAPAFGQNVAHEMGVTPTNRHPAPRAS